MTTRAHDAAAVEAEAEAEEVELSAIRGLLGRIVEAWGPEQIWLFGSRARGTAGPESDFDLLVVVPDELDEALVAPVAVWRLRKECGVRADIVPCRASDFREDRTTPNTLAFEAAARGRLVYEAGELVIDDEGCELDEEERRALDAAISRSIETAASEGTKSAENVLEVLRARRPG